MEGCRRRSKHRHTDQRARDNWKVFNNAAKLCHFSADGPTSSASDPAPWVAAIGDARPHTTFLETCLAEDGPAWPHAIVLATSDAPSSQRLDPCSSLTDHVEHPDEECVPGHPKST
jgi:hypothetical protein